MIEVPKFYEIDTWLIALSVFLFMILSVYLGKKIGNRHIIEKGNIKNNSVLSAGIYTLMAFILAFSFSMAGSRFDSRKKVIIDESNAIGTAILRTGMYSDSIKSLFMQDFSEYLEARISYSKAGTDIELIKTSLNKSAVSGMKLFNRASELSHHAQYHAASMLFIPALNEMLDIASTRLQDELYKVPTPIIFMLFFLLALSSFVYGYNSSKKTTKLDWYMIICNCLITCIVVYFLLDLDRPRRGLINLDESIKAIESLRSMIN